MLQPESPTSGQGELRRRCVRGSLRTADAFPVVAYQPTKIFFFYFSEGEKRRPECVCCSQAMYAGVWSHVCVISENRVEEITYFGPLVACHIVQIYGEYTPIPLIGGFVQAERQKVHPSWIMLVCATRPFLGSSRVEERCVTTQKRLCSRLG